MKVWVAVRHHYDEALKDEVLGVFLSEAPAAAIQAWHAALPRCHAVGVYEEEVRP